VSKTRNLLTIYSGSVGGVAGGLGSQGGIEKGPGEEVWKKAVRIKRGECGEALKCCDLPATTQKGGGNVAVLI